MAYTYSESESADHLLGDVDAAWTKQTHQPASKALRHKVILSILITAFNLMLLGVNIYLQLWRRCSFGSYERGFPTDMVPEGLKVNLVQLEFRGGVTIGPDGQFFTDHGGQEYVGEPAPSVDEAWSLLLNGLNIDLPPSDINSESHSIQWPDNGYYFTGFEVFHSLHCLNRLRQALYPAYYGHIFTQAGDPDREQHIGHCINHLRQALQCHADLTPMEWRLAGNRVILDTATPHTCRDFESIHDWAKQRRTDWDANQSVANGSLLVVD